MAVKRLKQVINDSALALSHIRGGFEILLEIEGISEQLTKCFLMDFSSFLRSDEAADSSRELDTVRVFSDFPDFRGSHTHTHTHSFFGGGVGRIHTGLR